MALSDVELEAINRMSAAIRKDTEHLNLLSAYYEGIHRVEHLGIAIPPNLRQFIVSVNWPRMTADALEERIDLEGFRLPGRAKRDDECWRIWQANDLDEESQLAHLDTIIYGRSYICVGSNEDDPETPIVTVESPLEMTHEVDPRTRKVTAALRLYREKDLEGLVVEHGVLYLPDVTVWFTKRWSGPTRGWTEEDRDEHNLGVVPVVPLVNRARPANRYGVSELEDVIELTDAAARALTLAQLATETLSVPQRVLLGIKEEDFQDEQGNYVPKWESYFSSLWASEEKDAKVQQFSAADLSNFASIVNHYAAEVASVTGLPLRYFGQNLANPPSEGAIVADEIRLIKRAERRHRAWGGSWERTMRLVRRIQTGAWDDDYKQLETIWRNPATPTEAQKADAIVKYVQADILPREYAWEEMGKTGTEIEILKRMYADQIADGDVLGRQLAAVRQPLQAAQGTPLSGE